ncbi:MAG TPA: molybdopterin cofactor-binding domain-containing protein, partial [Kofleriaceae bacterium]|nr:molybdopterin cofactor-binding domain-containing protein [Kofleriaceae bacterium]
MSLLLAVALAAAPAACKKNKKDPEVTWDETDRPSAVEQNKAAAGNLTAPAMFAQIPADTPYVFASFVPIPGAYWKRTCEEMCPPLQKMIASASAEASKGTSLQARLAAAVLGELNGNLSGDGLRRLGLSTDPRFAVYGLGPIPVIRIEVADPAALTATIGRIEQKAGMTLPTRSAGAQKYWYGGDSDSVVAAGLVGKELVITMGPPRAVDRAVAFLFGGEKLPGPTMADGAELRKLAATYGFAGYGLGYVDFKRLAAAWRGDGLHGEMWKLARDDGGATGKDAGAAADRIAPPPPPSPGAPAVPPAMPMRPPDPPPVDAGVPVVPPDAGAMIAVSPDAGAPPPPTDPAACNAAIDKITARFPRAVLGYDEISDKRASFSATIETDAATAKQLASMETRSPGVTSRLPDQPLFAFGGAVDVKAGRAFVADLQAMVKATRKACGKPVDDDDGGGLGFDMPGGLSPDAIRGAVFVLQGGELTGDLPRALEGYAIVGVGDRAVLDQVGGLLEAVGIKDFKADGSFRTVKLPAMGVFSDLIKRPLKIAGRDDALVVAAGDRARATAEKAMAQTGGRSPLFMIAYDVGRAVNPMMVKGQLVGGAVQGLGGALSEEFVYDATGEPL